MTIVNQIKDEVKNKLISLKIDCVTRLSRSIMGVNIQYKKHGKVRLATIAMKEIHVKHTSANLKILVYLNVV